MYLAGELRVRGRLFLHAWCSHLPAGHECPVFISAVPRKHLSVPACLVLTPPSRSRMPRVCYRSAPQAAQYLGLTPHQYPVFVSTVPRKQLNTGGGKGKSAGLDDFIYEDAGDGDDDFM